MNVVAKLEKPHREINIEHSALAVLDIDLAAPAGPLLLKKVANAKSFASKFIVSDSSAAFVHNGPKISLGSTRQIVVTCYAPDLYVCEHLPHLGLFTKIFDKRRLGNRQLTLVAVRTQANVDAIKRTVFRDARQSR